MLAPMNRIRIFIGLMAGVALLLSGCASDPSGRAFVRRSNKVQRITLRTKGEAGQGFTAKLKVDNVEREISAVSPMVFEFDVCVLTGTIRKANGDGTLSFEIREGGSTLGFGALASAGDSCRFRYHNNGIEVW
jgi:hypothetical protein